MFRKPIKMRFERRERDKEEGGVVVSCALVAGESLLRYHVSQGRSDGVTLISECFIILRMRAHRYTDGIQCTVCRQSQCDIY